MKTTTNNKKVIAGVQAHLLEWANDKKLENEKIASMSTCGAFVEILDSYMNDPVFGEGSSRDSYSWSTPEGVLEHFVTGGDLYYRTEDIKKLFEQWGLTREYDAQKTFETYLRLVCRDGARLYRQLKRKYTDTCFSGQIVSKEWLKNSVYGNPRCKLIITNDKGETLVGNTATNAQCAYIADEGLNALITYHTTKKGNVIIDFINMK